MRKTTQTNDNANQSTQDIGVEVVGEDKAHQAFANNNQVDDTVKAYVSKGMVVGDNQLIRNLCVNAIYSAVNGQKTWSKMSNLEYMIAHMKPEVRDICLTTSIARGKDYSNEYAVLVRNLRKPKIVISRDTDDDQSNASVAIIREARKNNPDTITISYYTMNAGASNKSIIKTLAIMKSKAKKNEDLWFSYISVEPKLKGVLCDRGKESYC